MELKIPGVAEPETPEKIPAEIKADAADAQTPSPVPDSPPVRSSGSQWLAWIAVCMGLAALALVITLQKQFAGLKRETVLARTTAADAIQAARAIPAPKDFGPDIARVEASVITRFKAVAQLQGLAEELKQISALEASAASHLTELSNTAAGLVSTTQSTRDDLAADEKKIADIVAVLRNQDAVLRRLAVEVSNRANP